MDRQPHHGYRRATGVFLNIVVGVIGALLAGFLLTPLFGIGTINQSNFNTYQPLGVASSERSFCWPL